jgi:murein L,D-transpeptidase YafK
LKEAMLSIQEGELIKAEMKFKESVFLIRTSYNDARTYLDTYFENFEIWEKQAVTTIKNSKKNRTTALLVDKFSRKCYLINRGNITDTFNIELGVNWIGDKHYKGDKATPEGLYFIKDVKENHETKYYKAFLIDYPNKGDLAQFKLEKKQKKVPSNASIGNLIEIHGGGGKGVDWTDGCIALRNSEMDTLFKYCRKGCPVTIVGSLLRLMRY